ncbi:MAG: 1-deoxy-D-xylulose-5-phosphate reductoisomerase, partial [Kiritimatiellae bacterium]|nr:1-deoxy-D-xylulose-5-phosphate reductoisomerase [Kiritimatiellia bacterium]
MPPENQDRAARPEPKNVVVLGATGSIGSNALRVAEELPGRFRIAGLAANSGAEAIAALAVRHGVRRVVLADAGAAVRAR